jgi:hypothetical protein
MTKLLNNNIMEMTKYLMISNFEYEITKRRSEILISKPIQGAWRIEREWICFCIGTFELFEVLLCELFYFLLKEK